MMPARLLCLTLATALLAPAVPAQLMRRQTPKREAGSSQFQAALRQALTSVPAERLLHVEESLRPSYEAFPKDARGNLPPHQVLPALVRAYFVKEHGWLLRGLESPGAAIIVPGDTYKNARAPAEWTGEVFETHILRDKAPELAAALKEVTLRPAAGTAAVGLSLGDVVHTVASMEQLLLGESLPLLRAAYFLNGLDSDKQEDEALTPPPLAESDLHEVLQSYLLLFRHGLPRNLTDASTHVRMKARAKRTSDWSNITRFESQAVNESKQLMDASGKFSWSTASNTVLSMAQRYGEFQNAECGEMKSALMALDKSGSGRVSLEDFHGAAGHPHYQFTEKEDYLRKAGILMEEPDNEGKHVLIANYLLGPSNCIASSEYFAVCCINECEGIVGKLESAIQAPAALAVQISNAVAEIRAKRLSKDSDTEVSPLPTELMQDLSSVADDSGAIVLHSPAFRQWLHLAFPTECPHPTAQEDAAEEAELSEAREWLQIDEAARQKWEPFVLHPSECTRVPEWHTRKEAEVGSDGELSGSVVEI